MNTPWSTRITDIQDGGAQMRVEMHPDIVRDSLNQIDAYREWQKR